MPFKKGYIPTQESRDRFFRMITKHGMAHTKQYRVWKSMRRRCTSINAKDYKYYGGRGIRVCKEWDSFESFWKDMKNHYEEGLELDRIDNNGDYRKENCRWTTRTEQTNNTRTNHKITLNGNTMGISEWARKRGVNRTLIKDRLRRGWSEREAVFAPAGSRY